MGQPKPKVLVDDYSRFTWPDKRFPYVIVDDYSRFTWVFFLWNKSKSFNKFSTFYTQVQNVECNSRWKIELSIKKIKSNHGGVFKNSEFENYYKIHEIKHEFSFSQALHQNGIVEKKNRTLQKMSRSMLQEYYSPQYL